MGGNRRLRQRARATAPYLMGPEGNAWVTDGASVGVPIARIAANAKIVLRIMMCRLSTG
jgi:hypothetical protein